MNASVSSDSLMEADGIRLDLERRLAYRGGQALSLGRDELAAMHLFLSARGRIVPFATLSAGLWPDRDLDMHNVRNVIYRLRRKLRSSHGFEAIVGEGYRLVKRC